MEGTVALAKNGGQLDNASIMAFLHAFADNGGLRLKIRISEVENSSQRC